MKANAIVFGWSRAARGKEAAAGEQFQTITAWFGELQAKGTLTSWEPVILQAHGGDLGGFFLLRGDPAKLDEMRASDKWEEHVMRAGINLDGLGVIEAYSGAAVGELIGKWMKLL